MTGVKICGVKDAQTCDLLVQLQVNWVGFVFYPPSPRYITPNQANQLPDYQRDGLLRVGLFVKPTMDDIRSVLDQVRLDILQLYTSVETAEMIRNEFKVPVWLAKGVKESSDLPSHCNIDGFVIEAPSNQEDTRPGGNGRVFDWQLIQGWQSPKPWLLAGGLTPQNVTQAIEQSGAKAVDISSGVERDKGVKDLTLIKQFVQNIRSIKK